LWRLNLMKKLLFPMILFLSLSLLIACVSDDASGDGEEGGSSLAQLQEAGKVTVGFANEKPYAYEEGGELNGAAVDIANAVLKELDIDEVERQLAHFTQLIPG